MGGGGGLTSVSMTRSTSSTVRRCGIPVIGHGTSSVRNVTFWSSTFSVSRTRFAPGSDFTANRRNGMLVVVVVEWFADDVVWLVRLTLCIYKDC